MHITFTYGKMSGGTPDILYFWYFLENGSVSERTIYRALIVHIALSKKHMRRNVHAI